MADSTPVRSSGSEQAGPDAPGRGPDTPGRGSRAPGRGPRLYADRRGVAPAVGKTLEIGLAVLFIALVTTVLLAGVVPGYRGAASEELGERVLVTASQEIEGAVPPAGADVSVRRSVDLPDTIAGSAYDVRVDGRTLVLDHPDSEVEGRVRLVLPSRVARVEGYWQSGADTAVEVRDGRGGLVVELANGGGGE